VGFVLAAVGFGAATYVVHTRTPSTTTSAAPTTTTVPVPQPPNLCPSLTSTAPCPTWRPMDTWAGTPAPVMVSTFPLSSATGAPLADVAWINTSHVDLALYPGYEGPGETSLPRGPEAVPPSARSRLLATFNSGFYEKDEAAGFFTNHTLYFPMIDGLATLVRYRDGHIDIVDWTGGARPGPDVLMARQNLSMLVDNGTATLRSAVNADWGLTLHGVAAVWRSGVGVDASGNLVYLAAPDQTSASFAALFVRLHVVRAMQLDINPEWPIFVTYGAAGARGAQLDVANPNQIATRFLYSSTKDFFALYATTTPGEAQPW